ncbi:MAG TPA: serine hydrolase domain-containing protein [Candidatus Limnocylindrales bacterium]|nr:serine hydrolase domain-containing protein [Candidatus Limnocylindrales bacterium]
MTGIRFVIVAVCLVVAAQLAHAQAAEPAPRPALTAAQTEAIDQLAKSEMARQRIPGLEVGVYSRGRILLAKGYGLADVELNVPVTAETLMQSGSVGKQFVSAAIMMLVEEHKLSLDDSITRYFTDAPASWKPILIKNLLSHTSGLSEYESDDRTGPSGPFYMRLDFSEDELIKKIYALPIEWPAGTKWDYRNTNYVILGILIHKLTGERYDQFLHDRIFAPLGMTSTRLISDRDIIMNRSSGYEIDDEDQLKNQEWVSPTFNSTADGTLYFNVLDVAKWDAALYTTRLLTQASLDRIWTVYPLNDGKPNSADYGFGWFIMQFHGHKLIEHSGAWQGFTCDISRYPDDSLTVAVLTNLDAGHSRPKLIAHVVAGLVEPALMPAKLTAIADKEPGIADAVRGLLDQIVGGTDIRPQVTPQLAARITPEATKRVQHILAAVWPGGTLTLVQREAAPGLPGVTASTFRVSKGSDSLLIYYGRNAEGKIAMLGFTADRP